MGPHILAGVNGSGKSTALKAIAWALDVGRRGFDYGQWEHLTHGRHNSSVLLMFKLAGREPFVRACAYSRGKAELTEWAKSEVSSLGFSEPVFEQMAVKGTSKSPADSIWFRIGHNKASLNPTRGLLFNFAAYAPAMRLSHLPSPDLGKMLPRPTYNSLTFQSTIQNEAIQAWLLGLYSKRAIARERDQSVEGYTRALDRFERALELVYGGEVRFEVEIEPKA